MKAILKHDYEWIYKGTEDEVVEFHKGKQYNVVARIPSRTYRCGEVIIIVNEYSESMSISPHPDYVTLIEDDQELITKLRYDGIEHVDINKQGE